MYGVYAPVTQQIIGSKFSKHEAELFIQMYPNCLWTLTNTGLNRVFYPLVSITVTEFLD